MAKKEGQSPDTPQSQWQTQINAAVNRLWLARQAVENGPITSQSLLELDSAYKVYCELRHNGPPQPNLLQQAVGLLSICKSRF